MSYLSVVYIGSKAVKRDTVSGSGLLFKPFEPKQVPLANAEVLLRFPDVWLKENEVSDELKAEYQQLKVSESAVGNEPKEAVSQAPVDNEDNEPTLSEVLEGLKTNAAFDAWVQDNGFGDVQFEEGEKLSERRKKVLVYAKEHLGG
ncbi:hypothetical protein J7384_17845 [Endozoicomonas sp. G2_1]|uniref:hypothetical protein n=1 Tax=Endozoicomonas sp. G2_1 TaxID=2821091 RepID=UPI001ADAAE50|nr:hypothetical protein [Endozoicomonas sp. G2_1]MBO9492229.1 hypothetical protein [Endozoicomonas sp. G2_1]